MYLFIKKNFNLKNLVYFLTSIIILFSIILFLFFTKFGFNVGVFNEITGTYLYSYYEYFTGFEIISFNANFYYKALPIVFNIFSILLFVSLLFVFINTIVKIFKRSNIGKLLKYISAGFLLVMTIIFNVYAWHENIIGPSGNGILLYISLYLSSISLLTYDGLVYLIKEYRDGSIVSKEAKGYYIVSSTHKVLTVEENIEKKFYSLSKSEKYIKKIEKENHTNIKIEKY